MAATDVATTARANNLVDDAIVSSADACDNLLKRQFFPEDKTIYVDWPNFQRAYPWRIWLEDAEIADITVNVPVVKSGTVVIPANQVLWGNPRYPGPPYRYLELDRSTSATFGHGVTPQRDTSITGTFGYWRKFTQTATLAASIASTSATTITVSASSAGVGDLISVDSERMLLTGKAMIDTTIAFSGLSAASAATRTLAVADGTQFAVGEVLQFDAERCLVVDISGNNLTMIRAWDGTILAAHTSGTIWANRSWTVQRGMYGTTAATHSNAAPVSRSVIPGLVHELALAESINTVLQKTGGYSRTVGEGPTLQPISGSGLADVRSRCSTAFGRQGRQRVV